MTDERRAFGQLEGKVEMLEKRLERIDNNVETLVRQVAEARGGWKGMMALAGFAATLGSGLTWIAQHLWPK